MSELERSRMRWYEREGCRDCEKGMYQRDIVLQRKKYGKGREQRSGRRLTIELGPMMPTMLFSPQSSIPPREIGAPSAEAPDPTRVRNSRNVLFLPDLASTKRV